MAEAATERLIERLVDLPGQRLEIACEHCDRYGCFDLGRLRRRYGDHASILDVYLSLTKDCRWQTEPGGKRLELYAACRARIMDDGERPPSNPRSRA